nr:AraC family ligand binding domain-containing protein [Planctomycetota bacterium]
MLRLLLIDEGAEALTAFPRHQHEAWMTIVYVQGEGEVAFDHRRVPFAVGTIVCVPPRTPYAETSQSGFRSLYLATTALFPGAQGVQVFTERAGRPFHRLATVLLEESRQG